MTTQPVPSISLPTSLALLARARARAGGSEPAGVLHAAVDAFARLPVETRAHLTCGLLWSRSSLEAAEVLEIKPETVELARLIRCNHWSADQVITAALAWHLAAF